MSEEFPVEADGTPADLAAVSRVAHYRLEERIGAGGMAVVFRARDERLDRRVALKVLAPALAADEAFRHRFIRESLAAAAVDDPNIIPVFEAGESDGVLFIAMRYVAGGDVRSMVRRDGPFAAGRAMAIISPVASALEAAHAVGLVHRDVKLANMLVDVRPGRPDHVYLSDFGLSKGMMSSLGPTMTGQFLGTPGYSAPEQLQGKPVDGKADQYSLACAAFELLCGETPFPRDQVMAVIWAHISEPPPTLTSRRADLPRAVDGVFAKALAKIPQDRYASCRAFADALRETLGAAPYNSGSKTALRPYHSGSETAHSMYGAIADNATGLGARETVTSNIPPEAIFAPVPAPVAAGDRPFSLTQAPTAQAHATSGMGARDDIVQLTQPGPAGRRKGRRALIIGAVTAVVVAGGGAALLAVHPWLPPPVLRPTGLAVQGKTTSSLTIDWSGPATGSLPGTYEILRDGTVVGTVPGTATTYTDSGLAPDSRYHYQVIAVSGGEQSPISRPLTGHTVAPPLSDARLNWEGDVTYTMESLSPPAPKWNKQPGDSWQDPWSFTPTCSSGPCDATLNGAYDGQSFTSTLTRSGTTYSGTAEIRNYFWCNTQSDSVTATLTINITAESAGAQGTEWVVKSFSGSATMYVPAEYSCSSDTAQHEVSS